jgi:hypothetical protein
VAHKLDKPVLINSYMLVRLNWMNNISIIVIIIITIIIIIVVVVVVVIRKY